VSKSKLAVIAVVAGLVVAFFAVDADRFLTLDYLKASREQFQAFYTGHPLLVLGAFFAVYVAVTGLSLPGAAVMTIAAGALFGLATGTVLVSFASTIGATLAFLAARWLFRDSVRRRLGKRLARINEGVERDGVFYLFSLRLVPAIPFFLINIAMALTPLRTWTFYWVSQLGMLPGTLVYVNAGTQLAELERVSGLLSWDLIGAFLLLAAFPWLARGLLKLVQARRVYRQWQKPNAFDRNLIVIGAGSAGLVAAYIGATVRAKVTLVEKHQMGGDCLNTGCVPSKALIKSARVMHQARHLEDYGIHGSAPQVNFAAVMDRIRTVIRKIEPHDSVERYSRMGVDCVSGHARIVSPWEVEISQDGRTRRLTSRAIVVATGAKPAVPPIPGLAEMDCLTSENLWDLRLLPRRLLVLGGGPIGCELAQAFARLGARVTQVEMQNRLLSKDEPEASAAVLESLRADGVEVLLNTEARRFASEDGERVLYADRGEEELRVPFDRVLVALGRRANTEGLGLDALGIETRADGTIETNEYLQTAVPNVYACGDVAGPYQFTHVASHQAWFATVNALFGRLRRFKADYSVIPWTTFTDPEVAHVGITEAQAAARELDVEVTRYGIDDLDRAIADGTDYGFIKVITPRGSDRILGATVVGADAGNLLAEFVLAMKHGLGLGKLQSTIHVYPTQAEANKYVAGEWRKAHAPQRVLDWVERYHHWMLNGRGRRSDAKAPHSDARESP
jgi:pyruvate/2-oxoglutarate dehydrogenase complex dihydrolipoamide dehydrogenase (E3) component/uncharacterized membrane protein YdjX (TVP38/TMEM64 family)